MMNSDGNNKQKISWVNSTPVKYHAKARQLAYINLKKKTNCSFLTGKGNGCGSIGWSQLLEQF
jgi:hypothetical protein